MLPLGRVPAALHQLENRQPENATDKKNSFGISCLTVTESSFIVVLSRYINSRCLISHSEERPRHRVLFFYSLLDAHSLSNRDLMVLSFFFFFFFFFFFSCLRNAGAGADADLLTFGLTRHPPDKAFIF